MPTLPTALRRPWIPEKKAFEGISQANYSFYNSKAWKNLRRNYLTRHPLCVQCQKEGRLSQAEVLDHIIPINKGGAKMNTDNLQGLCKSCNAKKTGKQSRQ